MMASAKTKPEMMDLEQLLQRRILEYSTEGQIDDESAIALLKELVSADFWLNDCRLDIVRGHLSIRVLVN